MPRAVLRGVAVFIDQTAVTLFADATKMSKSILLHDKMGGAFGDSRQGSAVEKNTEKDAVNNVVPGKRLGILRR
jgi:hypothetical protein